MRKTHPRIEACGEVDELSGAIGWVVHQIKDQEPGRRLVRVQECLCAIGSHLAGPPCAGEPGGSSEFSRMLTDRVKELERWIDELEERLPELHGFIVPGGSATGSALHLARAVCRRAERRVVALAEHEYTEPGVLVFLNRLSDLLFVLARSRNRLEGVPENELTQWLRDPY